MIRKHKLFLFLSVVFVLNSCTTWQYISKNNTTENFSLKDNPKKVILFKYQQGDELFTKTTFLFNKKGQLTKKESEIHNPRTEVRYSTTQWIYDENGFLRKKLKDNQKNEYVNDRWGREKKMYFYPHPDSLPQVTKIKYKPKKRVKISKFYRSDGTFYSKGTSRYDEKNNIVYSQFSIPGYDLIEEIWWERDAYGNETLSKMTTNEQIDTTYIYSKYNLNGNLINERYIDENQKVRTRNYTYKLDSLGNWIERTLDEDGYIRKEKREIEYFDDRK